jgi:hypothetical protein
MTTAMAQSHPNIAFTKYQSLDYFSIWQIKGRPVRTSRPVAKLGNV